MGLKMLSSSSLAKKPGSLYPVLWAVGILHGEHLGGSATAFCPGIGRAGIRSACPDIEGNNLNLIFTDDRRIPGCV